MMCSHESATAISTFIVVEICNSNIAHGDVSQSLLDTENRVNGACHMLLLEAGIRQAFVPYTTTVVVPEPSIFVRFGISGLVAVRAIRRNR